jgi:putative copper export protein
MFKFWLFLHFTGISIWVGSLLAVTLILLTMKKYLGSKELSTIVKKITRIVNILVHPSAFFVLVSGVFMIISMNYGDNPKPFYLNFMERFGGSTILFSIILISIFGRRLVKRLNILEKDGSENKQSSTINSYITILLASVVFVFATIFVVSFRF